MDAPPYFWPCLQRETASCLLHISRESKIILSPEKLVYKPIKKKKQQKIIGPIWHFVSLTK